MENVLDIRIAGTSSQRLGGLNNRNLFSHNSGSCKSKAKVPPVLISSKASLLGLHVVVLLLLVHRIFFLCRNDSRNSWCFLISSSYKDTNQVG